jgi:hypothetical protein
MRNLRFLKYPGFAILGIGMVFLFIFLVMLLWNWLIPVLFHGPVLSFWQTAGIFLLSKILLTGIAPRGHYYRGRSYWKDKYHDRWECKPEKSETEPDKI